ncbi:hypothetical protein MGYG_02084 [Nannizzia gypsea CBS 118893]|uniref:Uncharacterized protein n=1 Tax=Arthroderma gypseum (strain ATCC MYA-4604 / CBS 118893) TaxID=535722 RepID=E4UPN3_ARTGP|nr:hypothetical protein MGYG_02084 [Nannizzia gypsea CBS 118893]EFQ99070.1 hypothetical protein MGYG_02084 [Nannizzia gypsea CBS 118893]
MDVEHIVALLTEVESQNEQPRKGDVSLQDPLHDRLRVVLDGIAKVLISKAQGEVIAVGMQQQNDPTKKIIFTFASNGAIADRTLEHARNLVRDLQKLGGDFANFRRDNMNKLEMQTESQHSELSRTPSPWMDENNFPVYLQDEARLFRAHIYTFSLPKIHQRLHKPYRHTSRGLAFMDIARELPDDGDSNSVKTLKKVSDIIGWMLRHLPKNADSFPDSDVDRLVDGLGCITDMVQQLFKIETWQIDLFRVSPAVTNFPLERFLKKMSSITNATDTLLKYAYSPRSYQKYLAKAEVCVQCLENSPREIPLPESKQWRHISRKILANQEADSLLDEISEGDSISPGFHLRKRFDGKQAIKGSVHCECLLVLRLAGDSRTGISALPYIGVSKLSCLACWEFFGSLRDAGHKFYTKGSHAKAYFPWKFPDVEMDNAQFLQAEKAQILRSLQSRLATTYTQRFQVQERSRRLSDSSVDSATGMTRNRRTNHDAFFD